MSCHTLDIDFPLAACPNCQRINYRGQACPICFAEQPAKPSSAHPSADTVAVDRASLEDVVDLEGKRSRDRHIRSQVNMR